MEKTQGSALIALFVFFYGFFAIAQEKKHMVEVTCRLHDAENTQKKHFTYMLTIERGIIAHTIVCESKDREMLTMYKFACRETFWWQIKNGIESSVEKLHDRVLVFPKTNKKSVNIALFCGKLTSV